MPAYAQLWTSEITLHKKGVWRRVSPIFRAFGPRWRIVTFEDYKRDIARRRLSRVSHVTVASLDLSLAEAVEGLFLRALRRACKAYMASSKSWVSCPLPPPF